MSRKLTLNLAIAAVAVLAPVTAQAYDAGLVRIEPRPYYGAVVSIENGVRVYRPLPSQNLMIINPNQTPVNLSFSRSVEHKAAEGSSNSSYAAEHDSGARYGGISGLGNGIVGTNPQAVDGRAAGVGGGKRGAGHVRRTPKHH